MHTTDATTSSVYQRPDSKHRRQRISFQVNDMMDDAAMPFPALPKEYIWVLDVSSCKMLWKLSRVTQERGREREREVLTS